MNKWLIIALVIAGLNSVQAQENNWERNRENVETLIYDVVGTTDIKLDQANRMFDPVPPFPSFKFDKPLNYTFSDIFYGASPIELRLRPRPVAAEPEEKLYQTYVKAGFGNYANPYLNAFLSNKRDKEYSFTTSFLLDHAFTGAVDKGNSGEGVLSADLAGEVFGDKATLYGATGYSLFSTHFYGYPEGSDVTKSDIAQHFNRFKAIGGMRNTTDEGDFEYDGNLGLDFVSDKFKQKETNVKINLNTRTEVIKDIFVEANGDFAYVMRSAVSGEMNRILGGVEILGQFTKDKMKISGGIKADYNADSLGSRNGLGFFPQAAVDFSLSKNFTAYGRLSGGVEEQTWDKLLWINPWMDSTIQVANTINRLSIEAGIRGSLNSWMGVKAGFKMSDYYNLPFFYNLDIQQEKFSILYDTAKVNVLSPYIIVSLVKEDNFRLETRFDYYHYEMINVEEAWHRPQYRLTIDAYYNVGEKLKLKMNTGLLGGMKAPEQGFTQVNDLPVAMNIDLGAEYYTGSRFAFFMDFRNLLNNKYQLYQHYPVRGFQLMGGLIYKF